MARYKGTFSAAANYEPLVGGPFDARMLVDCKSDLTDEHTWQQGNGDIWVYVGMIVAVARDPEEENNGIYLLTQMPYTSVESWEKQADRTDIAHLQTQIDNIQVGEGGASVEVDEMIDLPLVGETGTTYYVKENSSIHRWDEETQSYISYGGAGEIPELNIQIIHGGNANGTN